jgi:hypothetical protein
MTTDHRRQTVARNYKFEISNHKSQITELVPRCLRDKSQISNSKQGSFFVCDFGNWNL